MGTRTSKVQGSRTDGSGPVSTESTDGPSGDGHDELKRLLIRQVILLVAGLLVIVSSQFLVVFITNSTRLSQNTGTKLIDDGSKTQKRSSCITDLRNLVENFAGQETDAVLNRLAVLDGYDPSTKHKIHTVISTTGKRVADPNIQAVLSYRYVQDGLAARDKRQKVALLLTQPTLNHICGKPVINKNEGN